MGNHQFLRPKYARPEPDIGLDVAPGALNPSLDREPGRAAVRHRPTDQGRAADALNGLARLLGRGVARDLVCPSKRDTDNG
jgi:hypothetical protein